MFPRTDPLFGSAGRCPSASLIPPPTRPQPSTPTFVGPDETGRVGSDRTPRRHVSFLTHGPGGPNFPPSSANSDHETKQKGTQRWFCFARPDPTDYSKGPSVGGPHTRPCACGRNCRDPGSHKTSRGVSLETLGEDVSALPCPLDVRPLGPDLPQGYPPGPDPHSPVGTQDVLARRPFTPLYNLLDRDKGSGATLRFGVHQTSQT